MKGILQLSGFAFCKSCFFAVDFITIKTLIQPGLRLAKVILCNITHRDCIRYVAQLLPNPSGIQFLIVSLDAFKDGFYTLQLSSGFCLLFFF